MLVIAIKGQHARNFLLSCASFMYIKRGPIPLKIRCFLSVPYDDDDVVDTVGLSENAIIILREMQTIF